MKKVLSISIAAYNVEKYLSRTLDSVLSNKSIRDKLEIIIVNDGSTDATVEIAKEYLKEYKNSVKLIDKENGGFGSTINSSIGVATGKYFKLLDGDDWFIKDNLEDYLLYLEESESDLIISPFEIYYVDKEEYVLQDSHKTISRIKKEISEYEYIKNILNPELTVKTSVLQQNNVKIQEKCFYTDTQFIFVSIALSNTISKYEKPVYCYQIGVKGQSVGIEGWRRHYKDAQMVALKNYEVYHKIQNTVVKTKLQLLNSKILTNTDLVYKCFLVQKNVSSFKKDIIDFDSRMMSNYPEIYKLTNSIKKVRILRASKYRLLNLLSFVVKRQKHVIR